MPEHPQSFKEANKWLIFGLGKTGLSAARFLHQAGRSITCFDTRQTPPYLTTLVAEQPNTGVQCERWQELVLTDYDAMLVSPGIALEHPLIQAAKIANLPMCGDIELFAQYCQQSLIAISGSNGKSTVTALVGELANNAGIDAVVGGNFGKPALECLMEADAQCFVLELSSFQLALTESLTPSVACLTNVEPDHLDWHGSFEAYKAAKQKIWQGAKRAVFNRDDSHTSLPMPLRQRGISVGSSPIEKEHPSQVCYWLQATETATFLVREGERLLNVTELSLMGTHNQLNLMMALAIGEAMGWPMNTMLETAKSFRGLRHRCERVALSEGVAWVNDSKATNVASVKAALSGLGQNKAPSIIWIAGGQAKGEDFSRLRDFAARYVKKALLIGESSTELKAALNGAVAIEEVQTLEAAVQYASLIAKTGDLVLLSPACASFDQFRHFEERGDIFKTLVLEKLKGKKST